MEAYSWEIHPTLFGDFPANHAWLPEDICFSTRQTWYKRDLTNWMCLKKGWFCKKWQCWWRFLRGSSTWEIHGFPVILAAISSQVSHVFGQFQDYFPSSFYQFWENHGNPKHIKTLSIIEFSMVFIALFHHFHRPSDYASFNFALAVEKTANCHLAKNFMVATEVKMFSLGCHQQRVSLGAMENVCKHTLKCLFSGNSKWLIKQSCWVLGVGMGRVSKIFVALAMSYYQMLPPK